MAKRRRKHAGGVTRLSVDFPRQDERVTSPDYTLRITAPGAAAEVDVSIDQGPWRRCRESIGHWWYDWSGYESGEHEIVTRVKTRDGEVVSSEPHEFIVDLEPHHEEANA